MKTNWLVLLTLVIIQLCPPIAPAKILGYLMTPGRSHFLFQDALLRGLAAKSHEVVVLGVFPPTDIPLSNYRYIQVELDEEASKIIDTAKAGLMQNADDAKFPLLRFPKMIRDFTRIMSDLMHHPTVEKVKQEERFDLVVLGYFLNDYQLGMAAHFQCPSVIISATPALKPLRDYIGIPTGVAYSPFPLIAVNGQMTFLQRILNHLIIAAEALVFTAADYFVFEPRYRENFPPNKYPTFNEAKKNVSLVMVNSHLSQSDPMAAFPGFLEVSGIQIKKEPNPLPKDIQNWLDSATDGAIFFSFGSNINSAQMSKEKREAFLNVFAKLKQKVLWKWEDENLPGKPDNVMIGKWLPQDDILAHRNVRLFISHCGKGSVNEAKYHGVPILGVPMFGDQSRNLHGIMEEGWALGLEFADLNEVNFEAVLVELLSNTKYRRVVKTAADLYKDRPAHALDTAVYWVEYVLRHNGARHMQSQAVHLNWFQYHSLDVIGFLLLVVYVGFKVFWCCAKFILRKCCGKSKKKRE